MRIYAYFPKLGLRRAVVNEQVSKIALTTQTTVEGEFQPAPGNRDLWKAFLSKAAMPAGTSMLGARPDAFKAVKSWSINATPVYSATAEIDDGDVIAAVVANRLNESIDPSHGSGVRPIVGTVQAPLISVVFEKLSYQNGNETRLPAECGTKATTSPNRIRIMFNEGPDLCEATVTISWSDRFGISGADKIAVRNAVLADTTSGLSQYLANALDVADSPPPATAIKWHLSAKDRRLDLLRRLIAKAASRRTLSAEDLGALLALAR
jgi:hypothetical protein